MTNQTEQNQVNRLPNMSADAYERLALLSFIIADAPLPVAKAQTATMAIRRTIEHIEAVETHAQRQMAHINELQSKIDELTKKDK